MTFWLNNTTQGTRCKKRLTDYTCLQPNERQILDHNLTWEFTLGLLLHLSTPLQYEIQNWRWSNINHIHLFWSVCDIRRNCHASMWMQNHIAYGNWFLLEDSYLVWVWLDSNTYCVTSSDIRYSHCIVSMISLLCWGSMDIFIPDCLRNIMI